MLFNNMIESSLVGCETLFVAFGCVNTEIPHYVAVGTVNALSINQMGESANRQKVGYLRQ